MWLSIVIGLLSFVLYERTRYPSLGGGDSGELLSESCIGGVSHPPGYGLYLSTVSAMLKLFNDTRPGQVGSLFSALCGGVVAGAVSETTLVWTGDNVVAAVVSGLSFAVTPLVWEYSTHAEVFALNNALCALGILAFVRIQTASTKPELFKKVHLAAIVLGLCASHQHASLLTALPLALWALQKVMRFNNFILVLFLLFITTLLAWAVPTLLLVKRSHKATEGSWGDLTTSTGFFRHILRQEYGTFRLGATTENASGGFQRLSAYFAWSIEQTSLFILILAQIGMTYILLKKPQDRIKAEIGRAFLLSWLVYLIVWHFVFSNLPILENDMAYEVHARFWMQPHIFLCLFLGYAVSEICEKIIQPLLKRDIAWIMLIPVGAIVANRVLSQWSQLDFSTGNNGMVIDTHAQAVLKSLPEGALLLSFSDLHWNDVRYKRVCEHERKDIVHFSLQLAPYPWFQKRQLKKNYPRVQWSPSRIPVLSTNLQSPGYQAMLEHLFSANMKEFKSSGIFIDLHGIFEPTIGEMGLFGQQQQFVLLPWGLSYRVLNASQFINSSANVQSWLEMSVEQISKLDQAFQKFSFDRFRSGSWEYVVASSINDAHYQSGLWLLTFAQRLRHNMNADNFPLYLRALRSAAAFISTDGPLTSSTYSNQKNALLAWVLLQTALDTASKTKPGQLPFGKAHTPYAAPSETELKRASKVALTRAKRFLRDFPDDKDAAVFQQFINTTAGKSSRKR